MTHFIVFEGIDGSGKTTLVKNVTVNLRKNFKVKMVFEADGIFTEDLTCGKYAEHNTDVFLFWARRFQQQKELLKEVDNYDVVIQDRYYDSTYVYQKTLKTDLEELKNIQPKHFNLLRKSLQEKL